MGSAMAAISMAMSIGMAVGPIIAGAIIDLSDIDAAFYFGAAMAFAGAGLFVWFNRSA
jgi:predicted MFS family arabinose efflux permease